jgi:hypothetical protein
VVCVMQAAIKVDDTCRVCSAVPSVMRVATLQLNHNSSSDQYHTRDIVVSAGMSVHKKKIRIGQMTITRVVQFEYFWEQGFDKIRESSVPLNCSSSLMCNFENGGVCWFLWSYSPKTCLICLKHI